MSTLENLTTNLINGKAEDEELAIKAIKRIEQEAHTSGLTDRITKFLEEEKHGVH